jgi:glycosyltransferase involved in cell wall biosynthesis
LSSPSDLVLIVSLVVSAERALKRLIAEEGVDSCLALWAVPSGFVARRACRPATPYAVWALGSDIHTWGRRPIVRGLVRRVLRDADRRLADGLALAEEVRLISGKDCTFVPTTRRLPPPAALPSPLGTGVNFLFVGRLEPVKGADVIVDAMIRLLGYGIDARLTMCGSGSQEAELRARVAAAAATDRIMFVSGLAGDVLAGYMHACDCLVIPSRNESIPAVFSEALQAGIPLLVTDVGDMGELAREHGLAAPVPPADAPALAAAMERFARDPQARGEAYESARKDLLAIFDVGAAADLYLAAIGAG